MLFYTPCSLQLATNCAQDGTEWCLFVSMAKSGVCYSCICMLCVIKYIIATEHFVIIVLLLLHTCATILSDAAFHTTVYLKIEAQK